MALDEDIEVSAQPSETSANQPNESLADQQLMVSTETASARITESDDKSQSGDSGDNETASDNSRRLKVATAATFTGISCDLG
jgi:hypothetical protein